MPPPSRRARAGPDPLPGRRGRGALMGLAVGNALAVPTAGRALYAPAFPQLTDGTYQTLVGGGPHALRKGQVTEPTQLAVCLGLSLRELKRYDALDALRRYRAWQPHAIAVSEAMKEVLDECQECAPPLVSGAGRRVWVRHFRKSTDAGALARTVPLGVYLARNPQARTQASLEDSALTHFAPLSQLACAALNATIAHAMTGGADLQAEDLIPAAESGLSLAGAALGRAEPDAIQDIAAAAAALRQDLELARRDDPQLYGPEVHLHRPAHHAVRAAFRLAFWELLHVPSWEGALLDVIHRGGDTEVHAAVAGALLGAFHGDEAIPQDWRRMVLEVLAQSRGPLWDVYHPRHLVTLAL
ncbi:ADP-ribosylglycohydrolase family protein [Corallococcus sp. H22C18031201]|uniref:ADP-ribosylglycohydrolase family protein n=1 Tax=Citreicoccus inhibens TaxID=2849499 RepID=UPI000E725238|nr:ADP-ribosylglycohydrolase family protein [Citreicoccus inhibens]MBU8897857.1 ADP-ribosylglycohydrolase family protein [Citreicoccus inhibens]RJS24881.1 ADP-ribosylglycohydrolase family protein [Corallococcus sp. H22C18031201]